MTAEGKISQFKGRVSKLGSYVGLWQEEQGWGQRLEGAMEGAGTEIVCAACSAAGSSTGSTWCQDVRASSEPYLWIPASQLRGLEQAFASLQLLLSLGCSLSPCGKNSP